MPPFEKLAKCLVDEISVITLRNDLSKDPFGVAGFVCGGGCGGNGSICGSDCHPVTPETGVIDPTSGVFDPDGRLGFTAKDLADIHNDLPKLRSVLATEIEANLSKLRAEHLR
jgi:hypothetical protein